jgi:hypothetical protein
MSLSDTIDANGAAPVKEVMTRRKHLDSLTEHTSA